MQNEYAAWAQDILDVFHDQHHMPMLATVNAVYRASPEKMAESIAEAFNQISLAAASLHDISFFCELVESLRDDQALLEELYGLAQSVRDCALQLSELAGE
ncbi:hypothetical protein [Enterobacter hormaechei]|uniref:hypothetical protein n=1 Tax=Enterobacter hormaechei TaxID=158836 RepID=UPI002E29DDDB|nr:hypothetical protein [Enterobacter hormaechei]MED5741485.1 hypothetical protein [Enterobacter hormaechei]